MPTRTHRPPAGRLIVVGTGMQAGRHAGVRVVSEIRLAERVFVLADALSHEWIRGLNPAVENLCECYAADRDRRESYAEMQRMMLAHVRAGQRVCAVFYGHPGVFAQVGRQAMARARSEGLEARMEPGISAEACLYADLDIDPGEHGVQSLEATQFLVQQRAIDPAALLLLWQVALAGNVACIGFEAHRGRLGILVDKLARWYPRGREVILYEAATLSIQDFRAERIVLADLPDAYLTGATTLVMPPVAQPEPDQAALHRLAETD